MSKRERPLKRRQGESGSAVRANAKPVRPHAADLPRRTPSAGLVGLLPRLWQMGNTAISKLLNRQNSSGHPLEQKAQAEMERAFGADFSEVRIHDDPPARATAEAINATAFTHGEDVYLNADAPTPDSSAGRELLLHELAHVVQQRQAGEVTPEMSQTGDRFEQAADQVAQRASQGRTIEGAASGAPPAIQRKEKPGALATRAEAEQALRRYFEREMNAQGRKKDLRVTQQVKDAVQMLFSGDVFAGLNIQSELSRLDLREPDEFASALAKHLPATISPELLDRLDRLPARKETPGVFGRMRELVERTAPGKGQQPGPVGESGSQKAFEQAIKQAQRAQGTEIKEKRFPPAPFPFPPKVDVLRAGRIIGGLPKAIRGPQGTRKTEPEARSYPEVERVIGQIAPDALTPTEVRGTEAAGDFADAQEFARGLARQLDVAQQQGEESTQLRLGDNYNNARDRTAIIGEINRIIQLIRDALPHHATNVKFVDVFFGEKLVTRGMVRRSE